MFLLDTNALLEMLLGQERAAEAATFLSSATPSVLHLTDFSLYSLGIILHYRGRYPTLPGALQRGRCCARPAQRRRRGRR